MVSGEFAAGRFAGTFAPPFAGFGLDVLALDSSTGMMSDGGGGRSVRCENIHVGRVQLFLSGHARFWNRDNVGNMMRLFSGS